MIVKLFNMGLRLASLALKLALTLYMGKYLGLADLGTFGLVAAAVAIFIPLAGMRLDYIALRELVIVDDAGAVRLMRDETVFYIINYIVLITVFSAIVLPFGLIENKIFIYTIALCCIESLATITSTNLISLGKQVMATLMFFVRSAAWVVPVVALGLYDPAYRTSDVVFNWWLAGACFSMLFTFWVVRDYPWKDVFRTRVNWAWIKKGVSAGLFIWIGSVALSGAGYIDRFVLEVNLSREAVGIASFYTSFTTAIIGLLASGIFAFSSPKMIALHNKGDRAGFSRAVKDLMWQSAVIAALLAVIIGVAIPYLGPLFDRPEFYDNAPVLWLLLVGIWFKSIAEGLYQVLYAQHDDKAIWLGNLVYLVLALAFNAVLIPSYGLMGIGYSAILSSLLLFAWRLYYVRKNRNINGVQQAA